MRLRKKNCVLFFGMLSACWLPAVKAQEDELPSAKEVIDRFVEALGGEMLVNSMKSFKTTGKTEGSERTNRWEFTFHDGKYFAQVFMGDELYSEAGHDGDQSWQRRGDRIQTLNAPHSYEMSIEMFGPTALAMVLAENSDAMKVIGKKEVNGRKAWVVAYDLPDDLTLNRYFDVETGLMMKTEIGNGRTTTENFFEYKDGEIAGTRHISKCRSDFTNSAGQTFTRFELEVDSIDTDPAIDESIFAIPGEEAGNDDKQHR